MNGGLNQGANLYFYRSNLLANNHVGNSLQKVIENHKVNMSRKTLKNYICLLILMEKSLLFVFTIQCLHTEAIIFHNGKFKPIFLYLHLFNFELSNS